MKIVEVTNDNFKNEIINSDIPVLVDFNADWCGPCRMLKPILESIADTRSEFKIASINIDNEQELAKQYGVLSIPCLVVFKDGKEVKRTVGLKPKDEIESLMGDI